MTKHQHLPVPKTLNKLIKFVNLFSKTVLNELDNQFSKDVMEHFIFFIHMNNNNTGTDDSVIMEEPIHYNNDIKRYNKPIYIED